MPSGVQGLKQTDVSLLKTRRQGCESPEISTRRHIASLQPRPDAAISPNDRYRRKTRTSGRQPKGWHKATATLDVVDCRCICDIEDDK